eukprot:1364717-Rhodomonas_salina.2
MPALSLGGARSATMALVTVKLCERSAGGMSAIQSPTRELENAWEQHEDSCCENVCWHEDRIHPVKAQLSAPGNSKTSVSAEHLIASAQEGTCWSESAPIIGAPTRPRADETEVMLGPAHTDVSAGNCTA